MSQIKNFCEKYGFDAAATEYLETSCLQLTENQVARNIFNTQIESYRQNYLIDQAPALAEIKGLQDLTGIHRYTLHLLYLIAMTAHLKELYSTENIPEEIYDDSVLDLKWKAQECKNLYGIWGISVAWWTVGFFQLRLFAIGRLQYELREFPYSVHENNISIESGERYINVHIPSGKPLDHTECLDSYSRATAFFRNRFSLERVIFGCESWLLSPDLLSILSAESRILAFMKDYTILSQRPDAGYRNIARIFNVRATPDNVDDLPEDTRLRREMKKRLKAGKPINIAFGVFPFEQLEQQQRI